MPDDANHWRNIAASLRDDARDLPTESAMLLHAAVILETAAATYEARSGELSNAY